MPRRLEDAIKKVAKLPLDSQLPEEIGEFHAPYGIAICPLLGKRKVEIEKQDGTVREKWVWRRCSNVDCLSCSAFDAAFSQEAHLWGCTHCADRAVQDGEADRYPYWSDGDCDLCGRYSAVRALLLPK